MVACAYSGLTAEQRTQKGMAQKVRSSMPPALLCVMTNHNDPHRMSLGILVKQ